MAPRATADDDPIAPISLSEESLRSRQMGARAAERSAFRCRPPNPHCRRGHRDLSIIIVNRRMCWRHFAVESPNGIGHASRVAVCPAGREA